MARKYVPPVGSSAEKVINHLKSQPDGTVILASEIADMLGISRNNVAARLRNAREAELLAVFKRGQQFAYSLPPADGLPSTATGQVQPTRSTEPAAPEGQLQIACWSDGDVVVTGCQITATEDGVIFTRAQAAQLVAALTTPHIKPAGTSADGIPLH